MPSERPPPTAGEAAAAAAAKSDKNNGEVSTTTTTQATLTSSRPVTDGRIPIQIVRPPNYPGSHHGGGSHAHQLAHAHQQAQLALQQQQQQHYPHQHYQHHPYGIHPSQQPMGPDQRLLVHPHGLAAQQQQQQQIQQQLLQQQREQKRKKSSATGKNRASSEQEKQEPKGAPHPVAAAAAAAAAVVNRNKPKWKAALDRASGRQYYYHRVTRVVSWEKPKELGGTWEPPQQQPAAAAKPRPLETKQQPPAKQAKQPPKQQGNSKSSTTTSTQSSKLPQKNVADRRPSQQAPPQKKVQLVDLVDGKPKQRIETAPLQNAAATAPFKNSEVATAMSTKTMRHSGVAMIPKSKGEQRTKKRRRELPLSTRQPKPQQEQTPTQEESVKPPRFDAPQDLPESQTKAKQDVSQSDAAGAVPKRPRGRAPKGCEWDAAEGRFLPHTEQQKAKPLDVARPRSKSPMAVAPPPQEEQQQQEGAEAQSKTRPRGRAPKGCQWDAAEGRFVPDMKSIMNQPDFIQKYLAVVDPHFFLQELETMEPAAKRQKVQADSSAKRAPSENMETEASPLPAANKESAETSRRRTEKTQPRRRSHRAAAETAKVALSFVHGKNAARETKAPPEAGAPLRSLKEFRTLYVSVAGQRLDKKISLEEENSVPAARTKKQVKETSRVTVGTEKTKKAKEPSRTEDEAKTNKKSKEPSRVNEGSDRDHRLVRLLRRKGKVKLSDVVLQTTILVEDAIRGFPVIWPNTSADHAGLASTALRQFTRDVILPAMLGSNDNEISCSLPVVFGTLLQLREIMIQNAKTLFGETAILNGLEDEFVYGDEADTESAKACAGEAEIFSATTFVTGIIFSALATIDIEGKLSEDFTRIIDSYDDGDDEFSSLLGPLDPKDGAVLPGGKSMEKDERDMWQASYNNRAEQHPASLKRCLRKAGVDIPKDGVSAVAPTNAVHLTLLELPGHLA